MGPAPLGVGAGPAGREGLERGGGIGWGHRLGCSGSRIMATLINDLIIYKKTIGLETMCIGGGQGMAVIVERL